MSSKPDRTTFLTTSALLLSALCAITPAKTIYVDDDATGANNGTSWADAYVYLQDALADGGPAIKPVEIRVAQGIYTPEQGLMATPEFDPREATFKLVNGVTLKGGYAGLGQPDPNARDVRTYETILSGDLDGNDAETNALSLYWEPTRRDNSYHVMTCQPVAAQDSDEATLVGGFTITGGIGGSGSFDEAGGLTVQLASLTVAECRFLNCAGLAGGAVHCWQSNITISDCTFENNLAFAGAGIYSANSELSITGSTFRGNFQTVAPWYPAIDVYAALGGGGMYGVDSRLTLTACEFQGNVAEQGGAVSTFDCVLEMFNCLLAGNSASGHALGFASLGGAIRSSGITAILTNCTLTGNSAENGSAIFGDSVLDSCILWGNAAPQISGEAAVSHSNIQGGFTGEANIDSDPLFVESGYWADANDPNVAAEPNDPDAAWVYGDYHLKSQAGRWNSDRQTWIRDEVTSPCIDASDPNSEWGQEVWPHGGRINMGAYGGTREASMSAEPQSMSLPRVAYVYYEAIDVAEGYQALLTAYGCPTTLIAGHEVATTPFDDYDLIIVGLDTGYANVWADERNVGAVESPGKPVVGLGRGGYWYFGYLGLNIGRPYGGHDSGGAIEPVDPNHPLFSEPYPIEIPEGGVLELCAETDQINIYLYPAAPETVTTLGLDAGNPGYYSIALENDRYLYWGFDSPAESLTEVGRRLFANVVIRTANAAWASEAN